VNTNILPHQQGYLNSLEKSSQSNGEEHAIIP